MDAWIESIGNLRDTYFYVYVGVMRYLAPAMVLLLLLRCAGPLLTFRRVPEIWGWLCLENGKRLPVTHWENVIGRSRRSDIVLNSPEIAKTHGVLTRYDDGSWTITDVAGSGGIRVNGERVRISAVTEEDIMELGGIPMTLKPISPRQEQKLIRLRTPATGRFGSLFNLVLLSVFQCLLCLGLLLAGGEHGKAIVMGFAGILAAQWALMAFYLCIRRTAFEVETLAFLLCTMGMAVIGSVKPWEAGKQLVAMLAGIGVFLTVGWSLRDLERAKVFRYLAAVAGIGFLVITLVFGKEYYGAKNWLVIGSMTLQPSELSKVCFVYAGASAMDRIMNKRNILGFIVYSVVICGCLALMNDLGTALIFFTAFLIIAFLRSGSVGTVALACTSLGFAGVVALKIAPHALRRFNAWRHVWEFPLSTGYQQTRSLMCIASGGLFGMGVTRGWMKNLFASDSDVVFATISEEWGLVTAVLLVLCVVVLALFALRSAAVSRSSFYIIGACTAGGILVMQVILNTLGTLDVLPLTGVTFPFLSNGGSSMIGAWGLLAFVKAADTRQNASFAVRTPRKRRLNDE